MNTLYKWKKKLKFTQNAMIKQAMSICHDLSMVGFIGIFKTILQAKKKKKFFTTALARLYYIQTHIKLDSYTQGKTANRKIKI